MLTGLSIPVGKLYYFSICTLKKFHKYCLSESINLIISFLGLFNVSQINRLANHQKEAY